MPYKLLILGLIVVMFMFELIVGMLNYRARKTPLPTHVEGLYSPEKYQKFMDYSMSNFKFGLISSTFSTAVLLLLLGLNGFGWLATVIESWTSAPLLQALLFILFYYVFSLLVGLPFNYYRVFVIEEKFGFNKMTPKLFFKDTIKNLVIAIIFGAIVISILVSVYEFFDNQLGWFMLVSYLVIMAVLLLMFALNNVFVRWFNKLVLLEEGSLRTRISELATSLGFAVKNVYTMDGSKRSTKLNAYFSGLGKSREVVLFDTLIAKMTEDQILAVFAHELGHATHKDITKRLIEQALIIAVFVLVFAVIVSSSDLQASFGLPSLNFSFALILLTIVLSPISTLIGILSNHLSRVAEYKADAFGAKHVSNDAMIGALQVLAIENLANLTPHPLYVLLNYDHPTIPNRIAALLRKK